MSGALEIAPVAAGELLASASLDGAALVLTCAGNADLRSREAFDALLVRLDAEARRLRVAEVRVDLRALEFMNSSCFKSLVTWIARIQDEPPEKRYRLRFLSNPTMHWQQRSLHALRSFAAEIVTVEA